MTVFHKAWAFLKASRQTELGEFHPDFPSSYGPVTMIRYHPTQTGMIILMPIEQTMAIRLMKQYHNLLNH